MLSNIFSGAVLGLETLIIKIETDVSNRGLPGITVVGLADKAITEAKERVLSALSNSDLPLPEHRTIINLSPADVPKEGSLYDLPIALGILTAYSYIPAEAVSSVLALGELSLNGNLMPIRGAMPLALLAKKQELTTIIAPYDNRHELSVVQGITIFCARSLQEVVLHLTGQKLLTPLVPLRFSEFSEKKADIANFGDVIGQQQTKRALEIAAAGFHNILLKGPPGTGKTMLARAFPSILPPLEPDEVMEVSRIYSINGLLNEDHPLVTIPPFRSPHHTISKVG
ncbi:MAG: magnesium chelatase domain-containing protein, partial [Patescibacteria group bacterium]